MIYGKDKLKGIQPPLLKVMVKLQETVDMDIIFLEGLRTVERQKQLVARGASRTMKSRHITGHAVDIAPVIDGQPSWSWPLYYKLAPQVKAAAKAVGVPIEWGGDWKSFKDGPHWQLPWSYDTSKATMPLESPRKPADEPNEVLRRGSSGERVKALQGALREQGYTIDVDGDFGERTAYVVSNFQKSNHLVADSIVGPKTLKLLGL